MSKGGLKELRVWQKGKDLAIYIYQITNTGDFAKDHGLRDQIRRAVVSIPSNSAEGDERENEHRPKDRKEHKSIACFTNCKLHSALMLSGALFAISQGFSVICFYLFFWLVWSFWGIVLLFVFGSLFCRR